MVLAAYNATLTRCNGCYEKDLAVHLNLIANTTAVIYYDPATDPYTTLSNWNSQLQATLTANIGEANYDIGHMFGALVCVRGHHGDRDNLSAPTLQLHFVGDVEGNTRRFVADLTATRAS